MRNYKKKTDRCVLSLALFNEAKDLMQKGLSIRAAAKAISFSESALRARLKKNSAAQSLGRFKPVFSTAQENEIIAHCKELDKRFYGLTLKSLRFLLFSYAKQNNIENPFNKETQLAGRDFTRSFLKRHCMSLRTPRKTSVARVMGFNRVQLDTYFDILFQVMEKFKFPPGRIYNVDESGFQTVPNKMPKHVAPTGKKDVAKSVSAEQGQTVTAICCVNPLGHYIPPYFIFARKRINLLLIKDGPTGCDLNVTDTGYINSEKFIEYLKHFQLHTQPTADNPVLLILDNHKAHVCLQVVTFAKEHNIHLVSLPPHSSHRTQPLDRAFFRPLKAYYASVLDGWATTNPGQVVTVYHVAGLFATAFARAATLETAANGFRVTGIYPLDRSVYTEDDYLPSEVTDQDYSEDPEDDTIIEFVSEVPPPDHEDRNHPPSESEGSQLPSPENRDFLQTDATATEFQEGLEPDMRSELLESTPGPSGLLEQSSSYVSPSDIVPYPKIKINRKRTGKGLKATHLTGTPHKDLLEIMEQQRLLIAEEKRTKAEERKRKREEKAEEKQRKADLKKIRQEEKEREKQLPRKRLFDESSSDSQFSTHDYSTDDNFLSDADSSEVDEELIQKEDFVIVKCYRKQKSYRLFVGKVKEVQEKGYIATFYERLPKTLRFKPSDEEAFVPKEDVVQKLNLSSTASSTRFCGTVGFTNELHEHLGLL